MSADATTKLVNDFYAAFKARITPSHSDLANMLQSGNTASMFATLLTPDFHLAQQNYGLPTSGNWVGQEAINKFFDVHRGTFEIMKYVPTIQMATADKAFVTIAWEGKVRMTGKSCTASVAHFFVVRDGRLARVDVWIDSYSVNKLLQP